MLGVQGLGLLLQNSSDSPNLGTAVREWQADQPDNTPILITADRDVSYDQVVKAMDALQRAGVQRIGLSVRSGG